jgi:hypothetical protein
MLEVSRYESVLIFNKHLKGSYNNQLPKQMIFVLSLAKKLKKICPHPMQIVTFKGKKLLNYPE